MFHTDGVRGWIDLILTLRQHFAEHQQFGVQSLLTVDTFAISPMEMRKITTAVVSFSAFVAEQIVERGGQFSSSLPVIRPKKRAHIEVVVIDDDDDDSTSPPIKCPKLIEIE